MEQTAANPSPTTSALACFRLCAYGLAGLAAGGAALAWTIDNAEAIWRVAAACLTFGGGFWPAVITAGAIGAAALACGCAGVKADFEGRAVHWLWPAGIGALLYVAAYAAMQGTYADFQKLTTYAQVAVWALSLPFVAAFLGFMGMGLALLPGGDD